MKVRPAGRGPWGFIQAFFLGGALVAVWMMPQWQWQGQVLVMGNHRLSAEAVRAQAQLGERVQLFRVDPHTVRDRLLAMEAVEDVKVRRWLFPARVEIHIQERSPRLRIADSHPPTYLDAAGVRFTLPPGSPAERLPLTVQLGTRSLAPDEIASLHTLLDTWPASTQGALDLRDPASWSARVGGLTVSFGPPTDLEAKLRVFHHLVPLARREGKALQYVDVRVPEAPTVRAMATSATTSAPPP